MSKKVLSNSLQYTPSIDGIFKKTSAEKSGQPSMTASEVVKFEGLLALRITTTALNLLEIYLFLKTNWKDYRWVVSVEYPGTPEQHFHIILEPLPSEHAMKLSQWKKVLEERFYGPCQIPPGNKGRSTQWNRSKSVFPYTLKDGEYHYNGYTLEQISELAKLSYKKFQKGEFGNKLKELREEYLKDPVKTIRWFCERYVVLKVAYDQNLTRNTIESMVQSLYLKKNPDKVSDFVAEVCSRVDGVGYYDSYK